jgi:alpha/beta superfamily hydrolase
MPAVELRGPAGLLVARHDPPEAPPPARGPRAALVCHPHPLFGGTLENKVVAAVARTLRERGLHVLRFNFRGAGGSEGEHAGGAGEVDDARAALDRLAALAGPAAASPGALLAAGYSFGSYVALTAALDDARVGALLAIAPPVNFYDYAAIARTAKPLEVVYSAGDEIVPAALVERWLAGCARPPRVTVIRGTGHLFHGKVHEVRTAVEAGLAALALPD